MFAVAVVAVRAKDQDVRYTLSINEAATLEEALGKVVMRMNEAYPDHMILRPSYAEITKEQMQDFLKHEQKGDS